MENDKQINDLYLEQVKNLFLSDDLLVKNAKPEIYSLTDEFAKSKKNKNLFVYTLILLYIAIIGFGAYFLTTIEENKNKRIEVNIAEFRQFNLVELLAEKKANEEKLIQLQQELEDFRAKALNEIKKLSPKEQEKAMVALNEKMKKLEENYNQQINDREALIGELERSIAAEKLRAATNIQENESEVKKYQTLSQMQDTELQQLKKEYEEKIAKLQADHQSEVERLKKDNQELTDVLILRYNPIFSKGEIAAAINSKLGNTARSVSNDYVSALSDENILREQDYFQLQRKIKYQQAILNGLSGVPYTNSVPGALNRLTLLSQSIVSDYETIGMNMIRRIQEKNSYISSYEYALNYISMKGSESGYVVDARNPNRIIVFIDHIYSLKKGEFAYIFKNDNLPIAKVELNLEQGIMTARVKEVLKPIKIEPFDKILLKLEVGQ